MSAEVAPTYGTACWEPELIARYEHALWTGGSLPVRDGDGAHLSFDVHRWLRVADAADETLLARCTGPTLDLGCGPGRLTAALAARGIPALGVDVAAAAVAITRAGGALALRRSVFDPLPGEGRWQVAVLADGNIGIGGNAGALLGRVRELLAPGGVALVEVDGAGRVEHFTATVVDTDGAAVATFPWARIGAPALIELAIPLGYQSVHRWTASGRSFVELRRC